jgi:2',3'-cyclic-nucleotide 2'-phosphodiesterase (5'-nucleotidase family)
MKRVLLFISIILALTACHQPGKVVAKSGQIHLIDSTLDAIQDSAYITKLAPTKAELEKIIGVVIGYAPENLGVYQPECPMLNWATDALWEMAKQYYPEKVDIAVVNIGSMRCNWGKGDITIKHVLELMPFDNELVVLTLSGKDLLELCDVFLVTGGEGIAGMQITAKNGVVTQALIAGQVIQPEQYYTIATSDYLSQGNDRMIPLKNSIKTWKSEKTIRDLYLEYIQQTKIVQAKVDGRFVIEK